MDLLVVSVSCHRYKQYHKGQPSTLLLHIYLEAKFLAAEFLGQRAYAF